jgi:hypothetical protein
LANDFVLGCRAVSQFAFSGIEAMRDEICPGALANLDVDNQTHALNSDAHANWFEQ